jgi:hypothetical protein
MNRWSLFRRVILGALIVCLLGASLYLSDPINRLRIRLTWINLNSMGWEPGFWTIVKAPADAKPEGLVSAYYASYYKSPPVFKILECERVSLNPSPEIYTVALVDGPSGRKLVVFSHNSLWWSAREYDP